MHPSHHLHVEASWRRARLVERPVLWFIELASGEPLRFCGVNRRTPPSQCIESIFTHELCFSVSKSAPRSLSSSDSHWNLGDISKVWIWQVFKLPHVIGWRSRRCIRPAKWFNPSIFKNVEPYLYRIEYMLRGYWGTLIMRKMFLKSSKGWAAISVYTIVKS